MMSRSPLILIKSTLFEGTSRLSELGMLRTAFLQITIESSLDKSTWEQVGPLVNSRNGLQRLPLTMDADLTGATGQAHTN